MQRFSTQIDYGFLVFFPISMNVTRSPSIYVIQSRLVGFACDELVRSIIVRISKVYSSEKTN